MSFNLATILRESAKATPDKPLVHVGEQSISYEISSGKVLKTELRAR